MSTASPKTCKRCDDFGLCTSCSAAKGCAPGTCAKGYSETTYNGTTYCIYKDTCHDSDLAAEPPKPAWCWDSTWGSKLSEMGCTQAQCSPSSGCTSCPKNKVLVRTCPDLF